MGFFARILKILESMHFVHSLSAFKINLINRIAENEYKSFLSNLGYKNISPISQKKLIYDSFKENNKILIILLDACRLDYFLNNLNQLLEFKTDKIIPVISHGSCTIEWLNNTFQTPLKNVYYIAANAWVSKKPNVFAKIIKLWDIGWNDNLGTVLAGAVNETIKVVFNQGANQVIAHYLQPHSPFVKGSALNVRHDYDKTSIEFQGYSIASKSLVARKEFIRAYNENMIYVLTEVAKLIRYFNNKQEKLKIIITSDHGECLGRRGFIDYLGIHESAGIPWTLGLYRIVAHPCNRKYPELVIVPWMELDLPLVNSN